MEGDVQQALLAAAGDERGNVKERLEQKLDAIVNDDLSTLKHDKETTRTVSGVDDADRPRQADCDLFHGYVLGCSDARDKSGQNGDEQRQKKTGQGRSRDGADAGTLRPVEFVN